MKRCGGSSCAFIRFGNLKGLRTFSVVIRLVLRLWTTGSEGRVFIG